MSSQNTVIQMNESHNEKEQIKCVLALGWNVPLNPNPFAFFSDIYIWKRKCGANISKTHTVIPMGNLQGCFPHLSETHCLISNWWFLNTILGALEMVTYGKSIRKLILETKTWQVHLLINSSVGVHIMSATGVLTTINPHFRQGEPYWHIFLIWIFN